LTTNREVECFSTFIAYEDDTGIDLAMHLKRTLEKRQIHTFVARADIPKAIRRLSDDWRTQIDRVINSSNVFVIILSSATLTAEMIREIGVALDRQKLDATLCLIICRFAEIPRTSIDVLSAASFDTSRFQQIDFTDKIELARRVNLEIDDKGYARKVTFLKKHPRYDKDQLRFRAQLRKEILRIGKIIDAQSISVVHFQVWNKYKPEVKRGFVGNSDEHDLIQAFYTAVQDRYDYQKDIHVPDEQFRALNEKCKSAYNLVLNQIDFVPSEESTDAGIKRRNELLDSSKLHHQGEIAGIPRFPSWLAVQATVVPYSVNREIIGLFNAETDSVLWALHSTKLHFGTPPNLKPKEIDWQFQGPESRFYAVVTSDGVVRYREEIKTGETIYFLRAFEILRLTLAYAVGIYREFGFSGKVCLRLEIDSAKGRRLETSSGSFWPNYYSDSDSIEIVRDVGIDQAESSIGDVIENIFLEFVRFFNWQITTTEAARWTKEFLLTEGEH